MYFLEIILFCCYLVNLNGKKALDHAEKLYLIPYIGNIIHRTDKFEILGEVLKIRERNKKLSKSCDKTYNYPKGPCLKSRFSGTSSLNINDDRVIY